MRGDMKKLWAPWRMAFINKKEKGCIFCAKPKENKDKKNFIIERYKGVFVMLNKFPYNNCHLMIAPFRHVGTLEYLTEEETSQTFTALKKWEKILKVNFKPAGFNIGTNLGRAAGAGYKHLHWHIVPRWFGDSNFMPVLADTKVLNDSLNASYCILKSFLNKHKNHTGTIQEN